jgi:2'-hydroxyisoflavone reductase
MGEISTARAAAAGLTIRPMVDTARDTLAWFRELPEERQQNLKAGLESKRETKLLALLAEKAD